MTKLKDIISKSAFDQVKKKDMPKWISPMLATLTHEYFDDPNWIYERKLDGERCLIYCDSNKKIKMMSRNKKELNDRYPEIVEALEKLKVKDYIVDGEIVAFEDNVSDFSKLQGRMHLGKDEDVEESDVDVYYYIFDVLYMDGYELKDISLKERKKVLKEYFDFKSPIFYTKHVKEDGKEALRDACQKGWEGLIAKDYNSHYVSSRSKKWLKFKCENNQEFVIVGFTDPGGERIGFGALLLGYYDDGDLKYAGKVGTGFTDDLLENLSKAFKDIETDECPLENPNDVEEDNIHWLEPKMVGQVTFTEWTKSNKLRHPSFQGIRDDKDPKDVVHEEKRGKD